jgi:hypothetical protein
MSNVWGNDAVEKPQVKAGWGQGGATGGNNAQSNMGMA